ncbi:hypothetical protein HBI56_050370 [Parastagonospora nodorum]|nr:hypothetical protein HBH49_113610 [Parastagonospora nodorum]KAH4178828.1 hypothetical protein HBH43_029120 [Parastagonospora nodorum]KAH4863407.1 hypothetical protein HBH75_005370 [Parastagonospora nodorum]KAH4941475.1 hypothetical protein HBI79_037440 [Parastagonospora nodorum]KAH5095701.1 hypothetical protein HBH72_150420 [Parastagonospora nodorum]
MFLPTSQPASTKPQPGRHTQLQTQPLVTVTVLCLLLRQPRCIQRCISVRTALCFTGDVGPSYHVYNKSRAPRDKTLNRRTQPLSHRSGCQHAASGKLDYRAEQRPGAEAAILGAVNIREPMLHLLFSQSLFPSSRPATE